MRKIVSIIEKLPIWYGLGVVFLYSLLLAEFFSTFLRLFPYEKVLNDIFGIILGISYVINILLGFVVWIIYTLLFHLTAILFGGQATFKRFLFASAYPYLLSAIMILIGIFLLDGIQIDNAENATKELMDNPSFKLAMNLINISFIPCYVGVGIFIHYIYKIKFFHAILSVVIPVASIWAITQIVTWLS